MSKESRTFKVVKPRMKGDDVKKWQGDIKRIFKNRFNINCPIVLDGIYGPATRSFSAALCHSEGMTAGRVMAHGVTPELRRKLNDNDLTASQKKMRDSKRRQDYRARLKENYERSLPKVHKFTPVILEDSWGYHPGVHDGLDIITPPDAVLFSPVTCKVIDVRSSGWWGLGAPADAKLKAKGDGIIQLEVLQSMGPFKKGMHIGYGHAEKAMVKVGDTVRAGAAIGYAGFANAWHIHLMVNDGSCGTRGVGNIDPRACLDYTKKHG